MDTASVLTAPPPYEEMRFLRDFGFYKAGRRDMAIALGKDSPPLFCISVQSPYSSQPTVILRGGPYTTSAPIATANLRSFSSTIEVTVGSMCISLVRTSTFSHAYSFVFPVGGKPQTFEWKSSTGPQVQALDGKSHGMKLVHTASGTVVAAWTRPHTMLNKCGKMRFTANDRASLGNDFEAVVVVTISAIMERQRRARNSSAAAGGAGGAAC